MVIFSHRGIGFGKFENSLEAISSAVNNGFSVEVDLRIRNNCIVLSHGPADSINPQEFNGLLKIIKDNPGIFFALHLKEDSEVLFRRTADFIKPFSNCIVFVTDFAQGRFIRHMFPVLGPQRLALYVRDDNPDQDLARKADYFWLDESVNDIYDAIGYSSGCAKKIILCSPELFKKEYAESLMVFRKTLPLKKKDIFGVCTDFPRDIFEVEKPICPVCGAGGPFGDIDGIIFKCNACGLEFAQDMHYDSMYYEKMHYSDDRSLNCVASLSSEDFIKKAARLSNNINWQPHNILFKWIEKHIKQGSCVLDIGCGVGWFIAALKARGYKSIGIEVSTKIVGMLRKKGLEVFLGPLEKLNKDIPSPELVVLLNVLEHVNDPVELLGEIRLRFPESMIIVSVPSPKRWDFALRIRNYWDYPPNHLTPFWTIDALDKALSKAGFKLQEMIFTAPISDEVWFVFMDWLFLKLGLRKKGYFVGLTSDAIGTKGPLKSFIKVSYHLLEKANAIAKYASRPLLNIFVARFKSKGLSGFNAVAIASPKIMA